MAFLFSLDLMKIAQEEKVIVDKEGNERGKYYVIGLTNGAKSFEVTCGERNNLLKVRSEERRVGKECRSRWSPYH